MPDDEQKTTTTRPGGPPSDPRPGRSLRRRRRPASGGQGEDKFRPEAIAARVERHRRGDRARSRRRRGGEEAPRAQEDAEEEGARGRGLQAPREDRRGHGQAPVGRWAASSPEADPLLERAARASKWIKEHRADVRRGSPRSRCSRRRGLRRLDVLAGQAQRRGVGAAGAGACRPARARERQGGRRRRRLEGRPPLPDVQDRPPSGATRRSRSTARSSRSTPGTGAAILARLAEGSLLLDAGDAKGATPPTRT